MEKGKNGYAWLVLAGCCSLTAGMGLMLNTGGQWFVAVTQDLGVGVAQLALYFTVQGLCMAATAPLVGKLLPKVNLRILLSVCYTLCILAVAAMSQYTEVWQWYISGAVLGVAGCFCFLIPGPVILGNWFVKKTGFVVGIAMSFSGISAAIGNPVIAALIANMGWRPTYLAVAVVTAIIVLPFTLFVLRFKPEDKGMKPYGYEEVPEGDQQAAVDAAVTGVSAKRALKSVSFWILFLVAGLFAFTAGYSQVLPSYVTSINLAGIAGLIASMAMIGNVLGKLSLGAVGDKFGGLVAGVAGAIIVGVGFLLLLFCGQSAIVALAGALFFGVSLSLTAVAIPILARTAFGNREFPSIFSTLSVGMSLVGAFGTTLVGLVYDLAGSYQPALWIGVALCVLLVVLIIVSLASAKKLPRE